jgi:hypothetical protein
MKKPPSVYRVAVAVAAEYRVSEAALFSKSRLRNTCEARQVVMFLASALGHLYRTTAEVLRLDRTTVAHGRREIAWRAERDTILADRLARLLADLKELTNMIPPEYRPGAEVGWKTNAGKAHRGVIATVREVGEDFVLLVRLEDGSHERVVMRGPDGRGRPQPAVDAVSLARSILDGRTVYVPVTQQLRVLATAICAGELRP